MIIFISARPARISVIQLSQKQGKYCYIYYSSIDIKKSAKHKMHSNNVSGKPYYMSVRYSMSYDHNTEMRWTKGVS